MKRSTISSKLSSILGGMVILLSSYVLSAQQTCSIPPHDNVADGSSVYASLLCNQERVDHWWSVMGMRESDWDSGFGYYDACNLDRPLARTFAALYLLTYSAEDYATNTGDYSGNALRWAYPYSANNIGKLQALCFKPGSNPGDWAGWAYGSRVELYIPYFYNFDVVNRAGTILHEARHNGGKSHNGGTGCSRGASCDTTWGYQGSNMYEVLYLWWFAVDGTRTTQAIRDMARNRARAVHNTAFNTNPGFNI